MKPVHEEVPLVAVVLNVIHTVARAGYVVVAVTWTRRSGAIGVSAALPPPAPVVDGGLLLCLEILAFVPR